MPGPLKDTGFLVALVTVLGSVIGTLITALANRGNRVNKERFEVIMTTIDELAVQVTGIDQTTRETQTSTLENRRGIMKIQRFELFNELQAELVKGETCLSHFRELSILFEAYKDLDGNGEIEVLFDKYKQLPIKEEHHD